MLLVLVWKRERAGNKWDEWEKGVKGGGGAGAESVMMAMSDHGTIDEAWENRPYCV